MALILRLTDLKQNDNINNLQQTKVNLTTYNAAINDINSKMDTLRSDMEQGDANVKAYADSLVQNLKDNEIKALQDAVNLLNADAKTEGSVDYKISQAVANLIDGSPDTLDTLKEIVDYVKNNDVNLENLIDSVNARVDALIDNASGDYNTLGKIESRIKELQTVVANNKTDADNKINNVLLSIPVYAYDNDKSISDDNKVTLSKVPYGDIMGHVASLYYLDADENIVMLPEVTVTKDTNDDSGKVYILQVPDTFESYYGVKLSECKAALQYFWRPIDNQ